jgi:hypothetical protein
MLPHIARTAASRFRDFAIGYLCRKKYEETSHSRAHSSTDNLFVGDKL